MDLNGPDRLAHGPNGIEVDGHRPAHPNFFCKCFRLGLSLDASIPQPSPPVPPFSFSPSLFSTSSSLYSLGQSLARSGTVVVIGAAAQHSFSCRAHCSGSSAPDRTCGVRLVFFLVFSSGARHCALILGLVFSL